MDPFTVLRASRNNFLRIVESLTSEQLNKIPEGYSNNIVWNLGHLLVTQQLLTYGLSGNPMDVSAEIVEKYRKGSKPSTEVSETEIENLKEQFLQCIDSTQSDVKSGRFTQFSPYETSFGVTLNTIEDAIEFNNAHEALHLGIVMSMRKLV